MTGAVVLRLTALAAAALLAVGCGFGQDASPAQDGDEGPAGTLDSQTDTTDTDTDTDTDTGTGTDEGPDDGDRTTGPVDPDPASSTSTGESFPVDAAAWTGCGRGFECATVAVPLDHQDPDGRRIDLALIRVPATGEAQGSIFVNLGGPGGSAVNSVRNGFRLDDDTMARYHLVGFDPRGIGASNPLSCRVDLTEGPRPDLSPDDEDEASELDREARELADDCGRRDGDLLPHLGTDSVIRDLDLLRQAVGDEQLHYIGLSYGTLIGLRYAERYPGVVGRMVIDGVVDPEFRLIDLLRQQAAEFERAFLVMDEACGAGLDCPAGGVVQAFDRLTEALEQRGPQGTVGSAELDVATLLAMYSEQLWPRYASALEAAEQGDFSAIERLHDSYVSGVDFTAYLAVSCIDSPPPVGTDQWDGFASDLADAAPRFGPALANEVRACAHWPVGPVGTPGPITAAGAAPILVLSTSGDAATPVVNATNVAADLESAGLVLVQDEGHTAYGKSFCAQAIVADYFETGRVPAEVHRC